MVRATEQINEGLAWAASIVGDGSYSRMMRAATWLPSMLRQT
jgi:hypothetical protein